MNSRTRWSEVNLDHARENLERYFVLYNEERLYQSLGYATPASV